ncbi:restriction endonuclease subunit S [Staphylococcus haemolyticus]|uniref:restriction endonuclease subunit S n=1 Tax=Staphylococcus haemolyticus TaxID=1283 RepID=UPI001F0A2766|nr:restriction endonuclease subunit S [Staphylococcus haemolyticus]MCH4460902.1 restriction endonuclease subunit S [Staphylococcus haemolyticus]
MESSWTELKLGEVINLKRGYDLPASKRKVGKIPIMSSSGINGYHNEEKVKGPGVITGRSGQLGKVFYIEDDYWPLNTTLYVEDFKNNYPKYVYYLLQTLNFEKFNAGSSVPTLNRNHVHKLEIKIPAHNIQKKIANILYMIDEKIQLNKETVKKLDEISQTLFKQWFIDFEFPNEEGKPYKSSGGEMVESELGEIPKGWCVSEIDNLGTIIGGGTPSKKYDEYYTNNGISWITPKDLSNDKNTFIYKGAIDITELGLKKSSARILQKDTVLFSSRAPIGYIAIAGKEVTTNQGFKSIVPDKGYSSYFIYHLLKFKLPMIEAAAGGSTFKEVSGKGLKEIPVTLPTVELVNIYKEIVEPLFLQIQTLEKENQNLQQLRDTLLPKLLSGEIEIPDNLEV